MLYLLLLVHEEFNAISVVLPTVWNLILSEYKLSVTSITGPIVMKLFVYILHLKRVPHKIVPFSNSNIAASNTVSLCWLHYAYIVKFSF
jgi:hypothetical protein